MLLITISKESVLKFEESIWFDVLSLFRLHNDTHFIACKLLFFLKNRVVDMYICFLCRLIHIEV